MCGGGGGGGGTIASVLMLDTCIIPGATGISRTCVGVLMVLVATDLMRLMVEAVVMALVSVVDAMIGIRNTVGFTDGITTNFLRDVAEGGAGILGIGWASALVAGVFLRIRTALFCVSVAVYSLIFSFAGVRSGVSTGGFTHSIATIFGCALVRIFDFFLDFFNSILSVLVVGLWAIRFRPVVVFGFMSVCLVACVVLGILDIALMAVEDHVMVADTGTGGIAGNAGTIVVGMVVMVGYVVVRDITELSDIIQSPLRASHRGLIVGNVDDCRAEVGHGMTWRVISSSISSSSSSNSTCESMSIFSMMCLVLRRETNCLLDRGSSRLIYYWAAR